MITTLLQHAKTSPVLTVSLSELIQERQTSGKSTEDLAFEVIDGLSGFSQGKYRFRCILDAPRTRLDIPELLVFIHTLCRYQYNVWFAIDYREWPECVDRYDVLNAINGMPISAAFLLFDQVTPELCTIFRDWRDHDFFLPMIVPFGTVFTPNDSDGSLGAWAELMRDVCKISQEDQLKLLSSLINQCREEIDTLQLSPAAYRAYTLHTDGGVRVF